MDPSARHPHAADACFDGGDLDCGSGLLLLIRQHIDPLPRGGLLEFLSTESSVKEDLPAWCRLTGNALLSIIPAGEGNSYLVCKGSLEERKGPHINPLSVKPLLRTPVAVFVPHRLPAPTSAQTISPLSVMGIGS